MDKQNMAYPYSGILFSHKGEVLSHAAACMRLENVTLTEIRQHKKAPHRNRIEWSPFYSRENSLRNASLLCF
jgi:hypothetical protein